MSWSPSSLASLGRTRLLAGGSTGLTDSCTSRCCVASMKIVMPGGIVRVVPDFQDLNDLCNFARKTLFKHCPRAAVEGLDKAANFIVQRLIFNGFSALV
jgi:hypothetical protein